MTRCRAALVACALLLTTACGSRLTSDERSSLIAALDHRGARTADQIALSLGTQPEAANEANEAASDRAPATTGDATVRGPIAADASSDAPDGVATSSRPCDATVANQVGVTDDTITVATIADVSGIQPGIFQGVHRGARAAAAYINSRGGICARTIQPLLLDDHTDPGGNRAAALEACDDAFVIAGSLSAFDDAGAGPAEACGIPDITAISTTGTKYLAKNTFPVFPSSPYAVSTTNAKYIAKRFPGAVKKAAILWIDLAVGKAAADARRAGWEAEGFEFVYTTAVPILEANYTRYVQQMRDLGVLYVHFIGDFQNMLRMQKTMRQQNYVPQVRDFDSITYDPDYLDAPDIVEGSLTFLNVRPFEEPNAEMKLFVDWYRRTNPGQTPDYFGLYAWSAYRLFEQVASATPALTRVNVLNGLRRTATWDGHGLHGPQRIGAKLPTTCNVYLVVRNGRFERLAPASGFDCSGRVLRR